jgi:O-antigen/teichoic acid export membrane protein
MDKEKRILIVFPDEWLQYSPSVLNLYKCCSEKHFAKLVYVNNGKFRNDGLADVSAHVNIGKFAAYFWRKTFGYKFYKVLRLYFVLLWIKIRDRKYDHIIAIDSSGYLPARLLFRNTVYFSLETEKDIYYDLDKMLGIDTLIIQSPERKDYMVGDDPAIRVFYIQNAPILDGQRKLQAQGKEKRILYMGNIEFGYGLEQFIEAVLSLSNEYSLTLKGIKNDRYFSFLNEKCRAQIEKRRLIFDFDYVPQEKVINYVSQYYIGITGYDLELAKQSFNYYSSPAGKLFNYYAAGIPVIGIDIIGLKSVKDFNAGALMDEVTPQKIKSAIEKVESDYKNISANSLKAAEHFDFRKAFNIFINSLDSDQPRKKFNLKNFVSSGHERSVRTKKNILSAMLIKCVSIVISFLLIPLALNYLNPVKYGIWLTLTSVIGWFTFFDLGLGNGLRNRLAEAFAKNDRQLARIYISTSYAVLSIIIGAVYIIFLIVRPYLNWSHLLNTPPEMNTEISRLIMVVFSFFSLQFIIKHISMILKADQRSAMSGGINTFASLLSLIIVFILTKTTESSLFWLSVGVSVANIFSPLIATIYFFSKDYRDLTPSLSFVKFKYAKDLAGLGFMFFVMQFASLILFSTDSLIISQLYGPQEVTPYNIAYRYFSVITMLFTIITTPFWSAYTDAYHKNDFEWIKRITRKLSLFWFLLLAMAVFMLLFSGIFYRLWIGAKVQVPFLLSFSMALWVLISAWTTIYGNFLSGVGKIRLSLYHSVVMIFLNIPLSVFLARHLNLGSAGVILGTCLCVLPQVFLHPLQFKKIVEKKDTGIWGK